MEEEATQPATQLMVDPRRYGEQHSGLSDDDLADVYCILHPITMPACIAVSSIHSRTPEHTINASSAPRRADLVAPQMEPPSQAPVHEIKPIIQDAKAMFEAERSEIAASPGSFELAARGITSCDIALRLSAKTKNPLGGFQFGRHIQRCDFVLGSDDPRRRISNVHFRIYINEHGIVMIEDTSTNGTLIDGHLLRSKTGTSRHTIQNGAMIAFIPAAHGEEVIKFIVRLPKRPSVHDDLFDVNLQDYWMKIKDSQRARDLAAGAEPGGDRRDAGEAPDLFAKENVPPIPVAASAIQSRRRRIWHGGDKYNVHDAIGKGAFATVYMVTTRYGGEQFACKELEKRRFIKNGVLDQKVENEMKIMSRIRHPNIVQFIEHVDYFEHLYLILEYVPNGDLGKLIGNGSLLNEPAAKSMTAQLLSALDYIHKNGITHRDVKPDNILIQSMSPFHVKLTDFGLSKMEDEETFLRTFCGTLLYCAPEVYTEYREYDARGRRTNRGAQFLPQQYSNAVDVWSLGAVLFYSLSGLPPYPAKNGTTHQELLNNIMTKKLDCNPLLRAGVSPEGIAFVSGMLRVDTRARQSIKALQAESWLEDYFEDEEIGHAEDKLDQIDMVSAVDGALEQEASQLSLHDQHEIDDSLDSDGLEALVTPAKRDIDMEIPSSFPSMDEDSELSSFAYLERSVEKPRLFGEIDPAALRSSGVIAHGNLNLALSEFDESERPNYRESQDPEFVTTFIHTTTLPQTRHPMMAEEKINERGAKSDMSLFGAESMVGNLYMGSPSPAATNAPSPQSPFQTMPPPPIKNIRQSDRHIIPSHMGSDRPQDSSSHNMNTSILGRRQERDDTENVDPRGQPKRPATNRAMASLQHADQSRTQAVLPSDAPITTTEPHINDDVPESRLITGTYTERLFWDPKDPSTHILTGQKMTDEEYSQIEREAAALRERAYRNSPSFPRLIDDLNKRRSASLEAQSIRARSAPLQRQIMDLMQPGTRVGTASGDVEPVLKDEITSRPTIPIETMEIQDTETNRIIRSASVPAPVAAQAESRSQSVSVPKTFEAPQSQRDPAATLIDIIGPPSMNALARFTSTNDSHMPPLAFEIYKPVTLWGRGDEATIRYWNRYYDHVSKYHFKLALWSPDGLTKPDNRRFYMSTQRVEGIRINNYRLLPTEPGLHSAPNRYWAEVRHNDLITISARSAINHLRFECFIGPSSVPRTEGDPPYCLSIGEQQAELDDWVLAQQAELMKERTHALAASPSGFNAEIAEFHHLETKLYERLGRPKVNFLESKPAQGGPYTSEARNSINNKTQVEVSSASK